jgi:hypothetical protein
MAKSKTEPQIPIRVRYAIRETMGLVVMALALFGSAGRIDSWAAWAALAVMAARIAAAAIILLRHNPDLLAERLGPRRAQGHGTRPSVTSWA